MIYFRNFCVLFSLLCLSFTSCNKGEQKEYSTKIIEVSIAPYKIKAYRPFGGKMEYDAYSAKELSSDSKFSIENIAGFTDEYTDGYAYVLKLKAKEYIGPLVEDVIGTTYELIEIISKNKVGH